MTTKTQPVARARLGAESKPVRGRVDVARLDHPSAFEPDADTPLLTRRELRELRPVNAQEMPDLAALRRRLRLSQGAFAMIFAIPLATVKDWEQRRRIPDAPARAYLRVISQNPDAVRHALGTAAE